MYTITIAAIVCKVQLGKGGSVETSSLTESFGWKHHEAFTQHDVQELFSVLLDAIENVFKGTGEEHLIDEL